MKPPKLPRVSSEQPTKSLLRAAHQESPQSSPPRVSQSSPPRVSSEQPTKSLLRAAHQESPQSSPPRVSSEQPTKSLLRAAHQESPQSSPPRVSSEQPTKSLLRAAGFDPDPYSSHSYRIGAATAAAEAGLPERLLVIGGAVPTKPTSILLQMRS